MSAKFEDCLSFILEGSNCLGCVFCRFSDLKDNLSKKFKCCCWKLQFSFNFCAEHKKERHCLVFYNKFKSTFHVTTFCLLLYSSLYSWSFSQTFPETRSHAVAFNSWWDDWCLCRNCLLCHYIEQRKGYNRLLFVWNWLSNSVQTHVQEVHTFCNLVNNSSIFFQEMLGRCTDFI